MELKSIGSDTERFVDIVEDIIQHFPKMSQSFSWYLASLRLIRGSWHSFRKPFIGKYPHLKELSKVTKVFSNDGRQDLINALSNISSVRVLVCSHCIFVVCRLVNGCYNRYTRYEIPTWWRWQWYSDSISKHWEPFIMDYPKIKFKWRQSFSAPELPWLGEVYCTCSLSAPFFLVNIILQHYFWINCCFIFVFKINNISYEPMNVFPLINVDKKLPFL